MEAWREHLPLRPFKRGTMEAKVPFHHRCRSRQMFGSAKDFCPNLPKLARKGFWAIFAHKFSPTKIMKTFFDVICKKRSSCVFCKPWVPFFEVKQHWAPFFTRIFRDSPRFSANQQNFWGCAFTPTSNTTVIHNSIISNFMVYQDRLDTNSLQLFGHPENSEYACCVKKLRQNVGLHT